MKSVNNMAQGKCLHCGVDTLSMQNVCPHLVSTCLSYYINAPTMMKVKNIYSHNLILF